MLTYVYAEDLKKDPILHASMFRDRADQFRTRLGWEVEVDENGHEIDDYDAQNPLYIIWKTAQGKHGGSMRVLPTTAPCMVNDHFSHIGGGAISSPLIWESTRFCLSRNLGSEAGKVSAAIMLGGFEIGLNFGLRHAVGVFDARMVRIYRAIGWAPEVLGTEGSGLDAISVGLWDFSPAVRYRLLAKAGISPELSDIWFKRSFGYLPRPQPHQATGAIAA